MSKIVIGERDDQKILAAFRKLHDDTVKHTFSSLQSWYFNRPQPDAWIAFIQSSSLDNDRKQNLVAYFRQIKTDPLGLMFLKRN